MARPNFRKAEWRHPNQQKIETGWKAFDRQTTSISPGQVCGGTQYSKCIRKKDENWPMGQPAKSGEMRRYDIESFEKIHGHLPYDVTDWLSMNASTPVILYEFSHRSRKKGESEAKKIVHGYIITSYDGKLLHRYDRRSDKSRKVMDVCQSYVVALEGEPPPETPSEHPKPENPASPKMTHQTPTQEKLSEKSDEFPPKNFPYRVFKGETGKIMPFSEWHKAAGHTKINKGDVLYMHDGKRWRIWTSAGLI